MPPDHGAAAVRIILEDAGLTDMTEAQRLLIRLGYQTGSSDGRMTDKTVEAIKQFEMDNDLPSKGEVNANLLRQLRTATLASH
mgnify:CR=1 FL=1